MTNSIALNNTDYEYSDLPDEEIVRHLARTAEEKAKDEAKEKQRMDKARNFRFSGGLC